MGTAVTRDQLQPGDLIAFYSPVSHVGIYIGNGQMVHAPTSGDVVKVASIEPWAPSPRCAAWAEPPPHVLGAPVALWQPGHRRVRGASRLTPPAPARWAAPAGRRPEDAMPAALTDPRTVARAFRTVAIAEAVSWVLLLAGMFVKWVLRTTELGVQILPARCTARSSSPTSPSRCWPGGCCAGRPDDGAARPGLPRCRRWHRLVRAAGHAAPAGCRADADRTPRVAGSSAPRSCPNRCCPPPPARLLARTARVQRDGRAPSLVAGVVRDGGLAWSAGPRRRRRAAHRRPVPAGLDQQDGHRRRRACGCATRAGCDLDDPLERHLPGTPLGDRTVGQLLSHLAGASAESPGGWWERTPGGSLEDLHARRATTSSSAPARRFHYSNLGFGLLGELVARHARPVVGGRRHAPRCWLPLGMTPDDAAPGRPRGREGCAVHPWADVVLPEPEHHAGVMAAAGQLWATLADLGRFAAFLLGDTGDVLDAGDAGGDDRPGRGRLLGARAGRPTGWACRCCGSTGARWSGTAARCPGFLAGVFVDREEQAGAVLAGQHDHRAGPAGLRPAGRPARRRAADRRAVDAVAVAGAAGPARRLVLGPGAARAARRWPAGCCTSARCRAGPGRASRFAPPRRRHVGRAGRLLRRRDAADRRRTTWTSARSSSPAPPTTPTPRCPAASTSAAGV